MDTEFMALAEETIVQDAIDRVREFAQDVDMISYLYVVDKSERLVGVTPLRNLLLARPSQSLGEIMNPSIVQVHTQTDQEEVAQLASRYDLLAIPVVDDENRLAGIVTIDDIVDIFKEEATEDFYKMVGTSDDELLYQDRSFKVAGIRLPWLLVNLAGLLCAGMLTTRFEETFQIAILVGFIPVINGMAGNIGSQTSTIAVRGLATGRLGLGSGAPCRMRTNTLLYSNISNLRFAMAPQRPPGGNTRALRAGTRSVRCFVGTLRSPLLLTCCRSTRLTARALS
jgi:magnesium transporter